MKFFVHFLMCFICTCIKISCGKKLAIYTHLDCPKPHVDIITDYNCSLVKDSKGFQTMNAGLKFKEDVYNIIDNFKVEIKRGPKMQETYLNMNIDICEALSASHKNFLMKMITLEILRSSNFPLECPLKKNVFYYIRNFTINNNVIPPYVPELEWSASSEFFINKQKHLTFISYGKIIDSRKQS